MTGTHAAATTGVIDRNNPSLLGELYSLIKLENARLSIDFGVSKLDFSLYPRSTGLQPGLHIYLLHIMKYILYKDMMYGKLKSMSFDNEQ